MSGRGKSGKVARSNGGTAGRRNGRAERDAAHFASGIEPPAVPDESGDDAPGIRPLDELLAEQESHEREALEIVTDLAPRGLTARLYRAHPKLPGGEAFLDELPARLVTHAYVREQYGGGAYRVEIIGLSQKGRDRPGRGKLRQETFTVDLSIPPKLPRGAQDTLPPTGAHAAVVNPPQVVPGPPAVPPSPFTTGDAINAALQGSVISMFKSMQELGNLQTAMVERMVSERNAPRSSVDWGEVAKVAVPGLVTLATAFLTRKDKGLSEVKELLTLVRESQPAPRPSSTLDTIREALALADELRGDAGRADGRDSVAPWWADLAAAGAQAIAGIAADRAAAAAVGPSGATVAGALPAGDPAAGAPVVSQPEVTPVPSLPAVLDPLAAIVRPFVPTLQQWAREGRPAGWAAETLSFELPEAVHGRVAGLVADPASVVALVQAFPALVPHEVWLQGMRAELHALLTDDGSDDGEAAVDGAP